jgi:hypothetical protein
MGKLTTVISCLALVAALLVGLPGQSLATSSGQGTLTWHFDQSLLPTLRDFGVPIPIGDCGYFNVGSMTWTYPSGGNWGPGGVGYAGLGPYQDGGCKFDGAINNPPHTDSFSFISKNPGPGVMSYVIGRTSGAYVFPNSQTFPAMSVDYDFYGQTDSDPPSFNEDPLLFAQQMYVAYDNGMGGDDHREQYFYTNYAPNDPNYQPFPYFHDENEDGVIDESGTVLLPAFILSDDLFSESGRWELWYGFAGRGVDETSQDGGENPVPEPATMLLVGTGLIGLASLKRRKG